MSAVPPALYTVSGNRRSQEHPMRKMFAFLMTTLDGYDEGPDQEFDFWNVDEEFAEFSAQQLAEADTLVFGRVTYEGMAAYWPTPEAKDDDPQVAAMMNDLPKLV